MSPKAGLVLLVTLLALLGAMPAHAQEQPPDAPSNSSGISLDAGTATDIAIERRLRAVLSQVDGLSDVRVDVNAGVVRLTGQVLESSDIETLENLVSRVEGVVTIENEVVETTDVVDRLTPAVDRVGQRIDQLVAYLPLALIALGIFAVVVFCGIYLARLQWPFNRLAPNAFIADIYRQIVRILFFLAAVVVSLDVVGAVALIGTVLGAAGIVGLAIGFAVRDMVENFLASVMLSVRQPFRPNDFVEIEGQQGNVVRLTSRATILLSFDGNHVRIPNATVFKSRIINYTRNPQRRFQFELGVDAEADLARAQQVCQQALEKLEFVLSKPGPMTWVHAVGDSNVIIVLSGWIDQRDSDYFSARGEAIRISKLALEHDGFGLPEPIYRLRFDNGGMPTAGTPDKAKPPKVTNSDKGSDTQVMTPKKDAAIEDKVDVERRSDEAEDLLSPDAPEE
ncbi:MAG: mechanosensitive ion channel family protein [Kiloniellales bacterium]